MLNFAVLRGREYGACERKRSPDNRGGTCELLFVERWGRYLICVLMSDAKRGPGTGCGGWADIGRIVTVITAEGIRLVPFSKWRILRRV